MPKRTASSTDLKSFRSFVSFRLHKLTRLSDRLHERQYQQQFGLNLREYRIIGLTGALGHASFRRICDESGLDKAHVSRLIDRLIERGLLEKSQDPADQRLINVRLTSRGEDVHRALHAASSRLNEEWLAALPPTQRNAFEKALDTLHEQAREMLGREDSGAARPSRRSRVAKKKGASAPSAKPTGDVVLDQKVATQLLDVLNAALRNRG